MAVKKYPWLAPGTAPDEAQAIAERIASRRQRRDHVITAWIEDAYIEELRSDPRRSRREGAPFIDDPDLADSVMVYRVVVMQRLKHEDQPVADRPEFQVIERAT
jgi:hypothetical protein